MTIGTDTAGDTVSLALVAQTSNEGIATASANSGFGWWANVHTGVLRKACDRTGGYVFTPLYALRRPLGRLRRIFRDETVPELEATDLSVLHTWCSLLCGLDRTDCDTIFFCLYPRWYDNTPWDPLDEDGEEDAIDSVCSFCRVSSLAVCLLTHF